MLTLIVYLFLDFIYVQYKKIKIKNKNILLIKQIKDEKKKIIKYIESQYIPFNLLKIELEITRKKQEFWNGWEKKNGWDETKERKKWTKGALGGSYTVIFPMESPTNY